MTDDARRQKQVEDAIRFAQTYGQTGRTVAEIINRSQPPTPEEAVVCLNAFELKYAAQLQRMRNMSVPIEEEEEEEEEEESTYAVVFKYKDATGEHEDRCEKDHEKRPITDIVCEEGDEPDVAQQIAQDLCAYYNSTLRPGDSKREYVGEARFVLC